jgi:hypothetical protein
MRFISADQDQTPAGDVGSAFTGFACRSNEFSEMQKIVQTRST